MSPRDEDAELIALSTRAAELRAAGDVAATTGAYREVLARFPDDRVTQQLLGELGG